MDTRTLEEQGFLPRNELAKGLQIKKGARYHQARAQGHELTDYDDEPFVKVFPSGMSGMYKLSLTAYRLMMVVIESVSEQSRHSDVIYLNLKFAQEKLDREGVNLPPTSWQRARDELVSQKILLKEITGKKGLKYFINPTVIFNGNRTKYMKSVIKECEEQGWYDVSQHDLMLNKKIDDVQAEIQSLKASLKDLKKIRKKFRKTKTESSKNS